MIWSFELGPGYDAAARRDWSGGRGLSGLRERVGMLGGELTAGEQADGRFLVRAVIPLGGPRDHG